MKYTVPIFIILQGPSVKDLAENIEYFKDSNVIWASLNSFWVVEPIIQSIGVEFSILYASSLEGGVSHLGVHICEFLQRPYRKLFISSQEFLTEFLREFYDYKNLRLDNLENNDVITSLIASGNLRYKGYPKMNSLTAMLLILACRGYRKFYVFGCDGGYIPDREGLYYDGFQKAPGRKTSISDLELDARVMNERFWSEMEFIGLARKDVEIYNVSPHSRVECLTKISMQELIERREQHGL